MGTDGEFGSGALKIAAGIGVFIISWLVQATMGDSSMFSLEYRQGTFFQDLLINVTFFPGWIVTVGLIGSGMIDILGQVDPSEAETPGVTDAPPLHDVPLGSPQSGTPIGTAEADQQIVGDIRPARPSDPDLLNELLRRNGHEPQFDGTDDPGRAASLQKLAEDGWVEFRDWNEVTVTDLGRRWAESTQQPQRHAHREVAPTPLASAPPGESGPVREFRVGDSVLRLSPEQVTITDPAGMTALSLVDAIAVSLGRGIATAWLRVDYDDGRLNPRDWTFPEWAYEEVASHLRAIEDAIPAPVSIED